jgi:TPR repeat protein
MYVESRKLAMGLAAGLLLAVWAVPAQSEFEAGVTAYKHGEYKTALSLFRPLAENGNPKAQTILGLMYSYGEGVPVDFREASSWYRRAAEQSYGVAQYSLAMLYLEGKGGPVDTDEAIRWLTLAAEGGHARAKRQLQEMNSVAYSDLATSGRDPLTARSPPGAAQAGSGDSTPSKSDARSERRSEIFSASRMPTRAVAAPPPPVDAARVTKPSDT